MSTGGVELATSSIRSGRRQRRGRRVLAVVVLAIAAVAAGCLPLGPPPTTLEVSANPGMYPDFSPGVTDYVIRCTGDPVHVTIGAPDGTNVSVNGENMASGRFSVDVSKHTGQYFTIVAQTPPAAPSIYYVRCLPTDFPTFRFGRPGTPQAEYQIVAPNTGTDGTYPAIYDTASGVPLWWGPKTKTVFMDLLRDGNLVWTKRDGSAAEVHRLDGTLVRTLTPSVGTPDQHDVLLLPNGNYVMVANVVKPNVDFTSWGGPASANLLDQVIEEFQPDGTVVFSWDANDHIPVSETDPQWRNASAPQIDAYHWNSIEWTGSGYVVSFRHLNAVFNIDKASGNILWKLSGSPTAESLTVHNDPVFDAAGHFGGQHDARLDSQGRLSLYDDGSNLGRAPRVVRYFIDAAAHTATLVESHSDPGLVSASFCCGSARQLSGGDWFIGWGGTNVISEMAPNGSEVFLFKFTEGTSVYRSIPVPPGVLSRAALRAGMNAQYP
jgi:Arylsulfotransferase (ASST)